MADGPGGENMKREREKRQIEKSKRENRNEGQTLRCLWETEDQRDAGFSVYSRQAMDSISLNRLIETEAESLDSKASTV